MGKHSLIVGFAALLAAGTARSASPAGDAISVAFQDCEAGPIGETAFLLALGVELDQQTVKDSNDDSPAPIAVKFRCDGVALIRIRLEGSGSERAVRFDDVSRSERPRALALVVAELYRSSSQEARARTTSASPAAGEPGAGAHAETAAAAARVKARIASQSRPRPAPRATGANAGSEVLDRGVRRSGAQAASRRPFRLRVSAGARTVLDNVSTHYGVGLGVDWPQLRLQGEALFARKTRSRGTISSGVAAARAGHPLRLISDGAFELEGRISAALGATWATGNSAVVGTVVQDVLMPYADVRLGLAAVLPLLPAFHPDLELYGGRAAGILARADGEATQATGGWFAGLELGASF